MMRTSAWRTNRFRCWTIPCITIRKVYVRSFKSSVAIPLDFRQVSGYLFRKPASEPTQFPDSGYDLIDPSLNVEEENNAGYNPLRFSPVRIGEVFKSRYQVVGKLGYGSSSTVWLCRDLESRIYNTLKVYTTSSRENREVSVYKHLQSVRSRHAGQNRVRALLDSFEIHGQHGQSSHQCLVHPPLGMSLWQLMRLFPGCTFTEKLLKATLVNLFTALNYLHDEAGVIHTDLQPHNILLGFKDESILAQYEKQELQDPWPRKIDGDRVIYESRPLPPSFGDPVLCDLSEARFGDQEHDDDVMPDIYRAPEVVLGMKWDSKIDIWNVGVMIWGLFESNHLFYGKNVKRILSDKYHLSEMIALLGPPPVHFLERSSNSFNYFDEKGIWRELVPIPTSSLEQLETRLEGENKVLFLTFVRKMLKWVPEERSTARELLDDPWLRS